jgi:hypothetical protein
MVILETDYNVIRNMTRSEKIDLSKKLAKRANVRLTQLEKYDYANGTWAYGKAQKYLQTDNRNKFYEGKKFDSERELNRQLQELTYFINAKTSTIKGINEMNEQRYKTYAQSHNLNKENEPQRTQFKTKKEYNLARKNYISDIAKKEQEYFDFLSSEQFGLLRRTLDSESVFDDFAEALRQGIPLDEIQRQYAEYTNNNITFEKVQEKYNRAKWQMAQTNGGNMLK